jgi:NAD(P)-dependent dehydrogenase (short-subunit alcohol dehydrogenase family)
MRVIVTGAARGIGAAIAARLVEGGGSVLLVDRDQSVAATSQDLARTAGNEQVAHLVGDTSLEGTVDEACTLATARFGGIDGLVNNAGIGGSHDLAVDTDVTAFREILDINLVGYFIFARAVARHLLANQRAGSIVSIGSMFGQRASTRFVAYCASKGGVALMSQTLALELARDRIRVNTVAPGNIETEMHWTALRAEAALMGTTLEQEVAKQAEEVPMGRLGSPSEIADAVVWLLSEQSSYVTGQTIAVNGGVYLS